MIYYKNTSCITKTFYGVKFCPGETKGVPGFINDSKFVRVDAIPPQPVAVPVVAKPTTPSRPGKPSKSESKINKEETLDGTDCDQ